MLRLLLSNLARSELVAKVERLSLGLEGLLRRKRAKGSLTEGRLSLGSELLRLRELLRLLLLGCWRLQSTELVHEKLVDVLVV